MLHKHPAPASTKFITKTQKSCGKIGVKIVLTKVLARALSNCQKVLKIVKKRVKMGYKWSISPVKDVEGVI